jgi:hypothetical protein
MEKRKLDLVNPITFGADTVKQLEFREPTVLEYRGVRLGDVTEGLSIDDTLAVASRCLTSHVPTVLNKIRGIDIIKLKAVIEGFLFFGAEKMLEEEAEISSAKVSNS